MAVLRSSKGQDDVPKDLYRVISYLTGSIKAFHRKLLGNHSSTSKNIDLTFTSNSKIEISVILENLSVSLFEQCPSS